MDKDKNIIGNQPPANTREINEGVISQHPENDVLEVNELPENRFVESSQEELSGKDEKRENVNASGFVPGENMPKSDRQTE